MSLEDRYRILLQNEQRKAEAYFRLYFNLLEQIDILVDQIQQQRSSEFRSMDLSFYVVDRLGKLRLDATDKLENLDFRQIEVD